MTESLHDAIYDGNIALVKALLDSGASIEELDEDRNTPLLACCTYRPITELINLLIGKGANINAVNAAGESALLIAARDKMDHVSAILLSHDVDVNSVCAKGKSPLFWAAYKGNIELSKELLHRGADPNQTPVNPEDGTPLLWAARSGNLELVQVFVNLGAEVNAPGVLHSAIAHVPVLEYLISNGADVNKKGTWGTTALHVAAYKCREEAVMLLAANGAHISVKDDQDGLTPYEWAREGGCESETILNLLAKP